MDRLSGIFSSNSSFNDRSFYLRFDEVSTPKRVMRKGIVRLV